MCEKSPSNRAPPTGALGGHKVTTRVGINGFGRIGRLVARAILERPDCGLELVTIEKVPFPRRPNGAALRFPVAFRGALREADRLVETHRPQVIVGFGGYVALPAYLAARGRVPIVVFPDPVGVAAIT